MSNRLFRRECATVLLLATFLGACGGKGNKIATPLTAPLGGEVWKGTHTITWDSIFDAYPSATAELRLSTDGGASFPTVIATGIPSTGSYVWNTAMAPDGTDLRVSIVERLPDGESSGVSISPSFELDNTGPSVMLTSFVGGEVETGSQAITWTSTDANPGTVELRLSSNSGVSYSTVLATGLADSGTYTWDTTGVPDGQTFRARIVATDALGNVSPIVTSATDFAIDHTAPVVALTTLTGGEMETGTVSVDWTTTDDNPGTVEVLLSADSGASYPTVLATMLADAGTFGWNSLPVAEAETYRVQVIATDLAGNVSIATASAADFGLDHTAPTVALSTFTGGEMTTGTSTIDWVTTDDHTDTVELRLSSDSGSTFPTVIATGLADTGSYSWDTTGLPDGETYRVQVVATDEAGNVSPPIRSSVDFGLDHTDPTVVLTSANGGDFWTGTQSVTWTTTDLHADTVELRLSSDSGGTFPTVLATGLSDAGTYSWDTTGSTDGATYRVQIVATDEAGNTSTPVESAGDFTLDHIQPTVLLGAPTGGELWSGSQSITWSTTDANTSTVDIVLSPDSGANYSNIISAGSADTGSFTWLTPFAADGTTYRMRVVATDRAGNVSVAADSGGDFELDNTPPVVTVTAPNGGETLAGTTSITWSSTEVNKDTVEIRLSTDSGSTFPTVLAATAPDTGTYSWDTTGTTDSSTVRVRITARDTAGNVGLPDDSDADFDISNVTFVFTDTLQALGSNDSQESALADVDGDGDLDLLTVNIGGQGDRVYTNNGSGVFTDSGQSLGATNSSGLAVGDVDGDGDPDLVVLNFGLTADRVFTNNGAGVFSDSGQSLGAASTWTGTLADIDGDGDLDLLTAEAGPNRVYTNNGAGVFTDSGQTLASNSGNSGVQVGDFDRDGDLDAVFTRASGFPSVVYTNDGSGVFTDSGQSLGSGHYGAQVGDVDDDGDLDIVFSIPGAADPVFLNNGSGVFADSGQTLGSGGEDDVELFDADGDGDFDLTFASSPVSVWSNDGGTFMNTGLMLGSGTTYDVEVGDIDRDGDPDIIVSKYSLAPNVVYRNDTPYQGGNGSYVAQVETYAGSDVLSLVRADLNRDGKQDVVRVAAGAVSPLLNDGDGTFTAGTTLTVPATGAVAVADFDADGDLDIVLGSNPGARGFEVHAGDGLGGFTLGQQLAAGTEHMTSMAVGDVDSDGDLDIVAARRVGDVASVLSNNGSGVFTVTDFGSNQDRQDVSLADVDGDGDLDALFALGGGTSMEEVWTNNGSGVFSLGSVFSVGDAVSIDMGDLDRDGDLDAIVGYAGGSNSSWLNNGSGIFTAGSVFGSADTVEFLLADVDRDGDLDVIDVAGTSPQSAIHKNDGTGTFTFFLAGPGNANSSAAVFADFDDDGDLDVFRGRNSSQPDDVWFNTMP